MSEQSDKDINAPESSPTEIDASYAPFPTFQEFAAKAGVVNVARWDRVTRRLDSLRTDNSDVLRRAYDVASRAAAIDTGAIEDLYETDRGFTFSVAQGLTALEAVQTQKGERVRHHIEAQIDAYEHVLDIATSNRPLTSMWIRQLHEVICAAQDNYTVQTATGPQEHKLEKGAFKRYPNHVLTRSGKVHAYAPVLSVVPEIERLVEEVQSAAFRSAFTTLQAAYVHYAFVLIHPFADGNGRVARALASIFTYRSAHVPVLILAAHRVQYFQALEAADAGDFARFANFVFARTVDAVELVADEVQSAQFPDPIEEAGRIRSLYTSGRGWTHEEIDQGATTIIQRFLEHLQRESQAVAGSPLSVTFRTSPMGLGATPVGYRGTQPPATVGVILDASTSQPAQSAVTIQWVVLVPRADSEHEEYMLFNPANGETAYFPMEDVLAGDDTTSEMRLQMLARRIISSAISGLRAQAESVLRSKGY